MDDPIKTRSNVLADLARVKALFQQRAIVAHLGKMPPGSRHDQDPSAPQREGSE